MEVETIETSCCGMAGAFGYGKDTFDISMKMANEKLFPAIKNTNKNVKNFLNLNLRHHVFCDCNQCLIASCFFVLACSLKNSG